MKKLNLLKKGLIVAILATSASQVYAEQAAPTASAMPDLSALMADNTPALPEKANYVDDSRLSKVDQLQAAIDKYGINELYKQGFKPLTITKESWLTNDYANLKDPKGFKGWLLIVNEDGTYAYSNGNQWVGLDTSLKFDQNSSQYLKSAYKGKIDAVGGQKPQLSFDDRGSVLTGIYSGPDLLQSMIGSKTRSGKVEVSKAYSNLLSLYDIKPNNSKNIVILRAGGNGIDRENEIFIFNNKGILLNSASNQYANLYDAKTLANMVASAVYPKSKIKIVDEYRASNSEDFESEIDFKTAKPSMVLNYFKKNGLVD